MMINGAHGRRTDMGDRLFESLLTNDPFGPRFDPALVRQATRFEQEQSGVADWPGPDWITFRLYAGETLIAERTLGRQRGQGEWVTDATIPDTAISG